MPAPNHSFPNLILASSSPRRKQLLEAAGLPFSVILPDEGAECGICSRETPPELVARLAMQKGANVASRTAEGTILAADTVAECMGQILGKPADRQHAEQMLRLLRGRPQSVYTGVCLWSRPDNRMLLDVSRSKLRMASINDQQLASYLDSGLWEGKAGAFGYQDEIDWIELVEGSESNVVGLPIERLMVLIEQFDQLASIVDPHEVKPPR